jgi:dolichol kinase
MDPETPATELPPELQELVDRTEGLQPWRRLFHAANGTIIVVLLANGVVSVDVMRIIVAAALFGALTVDLIRFRVPAVQRMFFRSMAHLASPREAGGMASSTWYLIGVLLALLLFPLDIAMASIMVLALGDPAASYVGRRWGKHRIPGDGSIEGTAVFAAVALGVLLVFFPPLYATLGALAATVIERIPWGLDDNLTLPVGTGLALSLIGMLLGGGTG